MLPPSPILCLVHYIVQVEDVLSGAWGWRQHTSRGIRGQRDKQWSIRIAALNIN
jgi:hypothetical protein